MNVELILQETFVARVEHHASLGSTNDRARVCAAEEPGPLPLLIVADQQTAGRGRGANRWWTGRGGLAFSLLVKLEEMGKQRARSPVVGLAAALAVARAVSPLVPGRTVGLHWPNDVFVGDRKLAGVLVEGLAGHLYVIGVGLNTNNRLDEAPADVQRRAATLFDLTGRYYEHTTLLLAILAHLAGALELVRSRPAEVAAEADAICLQHGRTITVESGRRTVTGVCRGIATDGALLLDTPTGREAIHSGVLRHEQ
jgi:BirA family biotin operon repressor/biotin-[acetyl-CoA-carboxylase] ligase